eukprot:4533140-Pleurochrysis_carterae.AAC.1
MGGGEEHEKACCRAKAEGTQCGRAPPCASRATVLRGHRRAQQDLTHGRRARRGSHAIADWHTTTAERDTVQP